MTATDAIKCLYKYIDDLPIKYQHLCAPVLLDKSFQESPGGVTRHHQYKHGLIVHTGEVMNNAMKMAYLLPLDLKNILTVATLWHDYMKTVEYSMNEQGEIITTAYRRTMGHLTGSVLAFQTEALKQKIEESFYVPVIHCMLSHHGVREWGSPVEPQTAEATILHAADMMSMKGIIL